MKLENQIILIVSNEPWGNIWFSKHNYAYELSKKNRVYFVNPVAKWNFWNLFLKKIRIQKISDKLHVINYDNILPSLTLSLFELNNYLVSKRIGQFLRKQKVSEFILWTFDPCRLYSKESIGAKTLIFHSVDEHNFRHPGEKLLSKNADFIFCVSQSFLKTYQPLNKSVYLVPHGISSEEFSVTEKELLMLDIKYKNYGIYVGNIDERIDFEQLEIVLKKHPDVDFVFVGKRDTSQEKEFEKKFFDGKYKNMHLIGPRHFKSLKPYIANSKFCIAFMTDKHWGNRISHHKIFQYLAFGKPIFSCNFSEYEKVKDLLYMENDKNLLASKLENFLKNGEDNTLKELRISYALSHTFEEIFAAAEKIISHKE